MLITLIYVGLSWGAESAASFPVLGTSESTSILPIAPDPVSKRQLTDIVWSCLAATVSCTWVSVHVNVPFYKDRGWTDQGCRLWLMLLSIITPDIVIMWAFIQMRGAHDIKVRVNGIIDKLNEDKEEHQKLRHWTMAHGHFLQMGGFSLFCDSDDRECLINTPYQTRNNIGWEGALLDDDFIRLVKAGLLDIPTITEEEINDRSKADAFSKGFALLQSVWFVLQIVARHFQHMAITELELTTLALVALNSVMYICWWYKPLLVRCPVVLTPVRDGSECNILEVRVVGPSTNFSILGAMAKLPRIIGSLFVSFGFSIVGALTSLFSWTLRCIRSVKDIGKSLLSHIQEQKASGKPSWIFRDICSLFLIVLLLPVTITSLLVNTPLEALFDPKPNPSKTLDEEPKAPWLEINSDTYNYLVKIRAVPNLKSVRKVFHEVYRINSIMMYSRSPDSPSLLLFTFLGFVGATFGGIHCFAWNSNFPSFIEKVLWRTSSMMVVGMCIIICVGTFIVKFKRITYSPQFANISNFLIKFGLFVIPPLYTLSRLSLLVQAVVSLRNLPPSAFDTVEWTKFIPHI